MRSLKSLMNLEGRVALITGAAGHIGRAMAEALAELGAAIVVLDLKESHCVEVADSLKRQFDIAAMPLPVDLADESQVRGVPVEIAKRFQRLDILVNCAALVGKSNLKGWACPFLEQEIPAWRQALEVNLTAPFVLVQSCASLLETHRCGSIVNVSSIYGLVGPHLRLYEGTTLGNPAAYAATKGALLQMTRWFATVLAPHTRSNAISPGGILRNQDVGFQAQYVARTPLQRMGTEEDLKGAVAYLASDLSRYVTGQNIVVDGGWTAW